MGIGTRIQQLRINNGLTQEKLAEMLNVSRQYVSKWEMEQSLPEVDKIVLMSRLFGVGTNEILLEAADLKKLRPQEIHLGSVYLIARDFEKSIAFYEKLLSMTVSTRNCGNKFAEFFFDNKCLAIMNEANLPGHHYDFVNITLHNFLKKNEFFGSPPIFTSLRFVNIGGDPVA